MFYFDVKLIILINVRFCGQDVYSVSTLLITIMTLFAAIMNFCFSWSNQIQSQKSLSNNLTLLFLEIPITIPHSIPFETLSTWVSQLVNSDQC